jgi:hypothetical protein
MRMKSLLMYLFSMIACMGILTCVSCDLNDPISVRPQETPVIPALAQGHGGLNGPHYNLNIIGVPKDKTADMDGNQGHRIFVKLWGNSKIMLAEGEDFQVLDANGTDGDGAKFQLPDPFPDSDLVSTYVVYARALGTPGGWSYTTTCYEDESGEVVCSGDTLYLERKHGQPKFRDVSKELLTLWVDTDDDGVPDTRIGLFDEEAYQYFWDYDNYGLKLAQLRFYPVSEDLSGN